MEKENHLIWQFDSNFKVLCRNNVNGSASSSQVKPLLNQNCLNKLAKLGDAIAISKSETMNDSLTDWGVTGVSAIASKNWGSKKC